MPRAPLRRAASSSEPSERRAQHGWSSLIGFSITTRRRAWVAGAEAQPVAEASVGEAPADDLVQAAADERVDGPAAQLLLRREPAGRPAPGGQRRRQLLEAVERATSSTRSASRVTSLRRKAGTVTSRPSGASATPNSSARRISAWRSRAMAMPSRPSTRASRRRMTVRPGGPSPPTSIVPGATLAPVSSIISWVATTWASIACSGARPFSKRPLASLRRASFCEVRWMLGPFHDGDLHQHARRALVHLGALAAHHAGDRRRPVGVVDDEHLAVERADLSVERGDLLAVARPAHDQAPAGDAIEVEGVQRVPGEEHRVVGDVDDVVDRALPRGHQPRLQPRRRRADRDVLEHARGEARAQVGGLDHDLGAGDLARRAGVLSPRRRRQRRARRGVDLARDAVDAEAVGAVRRDLELEHVVGDRQHVGERRAGGQRVVEDHDPVVVGADRRARPRPGSCRATSGRAALPVLSRVPSGMTAPGRATATV